jgi:mannose-1-phosphate guanylyltransferase
LVNAGTYVFEPDVLDLVPPGRRVSVERETFPLLVAEGTLYAVATEDYWLDTGRPDLYRRANLDIVSGARSWVRAAAVSPAAEIDAGAHVECSVIGSGARVDHGATVVGSVVLDGVVIGRSAEVVDSILGPESKVAEGAGVVRVVLGAGAAVGSGERLVDARRPEPTDAV